VVQCQGEVVRFLAYTGLRWGEIAARRVCDFDMQRRRVNISRSITESGGLVWSTPKTHERRSVPFPAVLADEMAALMVGMGRDELVFTDMHGGVLRNPIGGQGSSRQPLPGAGRPTSRSRPSLHTICGTPPPASRSTRARISKRCNGCWGKPRDL
jgi:integrase